MNSSDRGAWWATVHEVAETWTRLSNEYFHSHLFLSTPADVLLFHNDNAAAAAAAKSLQLCPTLCNPIDGSPPGIPVPGILQARTLEWATISFSNA